jgi:uncharacterized membrane protein
MRYNGVMSRESLVLLLGVVVFLVPGSGLPEVWIENGLKIVGIILMVLGYTLRRSAYYRKTDRGNGERGNDSFVESTPQTTNVVEVDNK